MSFTIDGIEIETQPATLVSLDCGEFPIVSGHGVQVGDWVACDAHALTDFDQKMTPSCQVEGLVRTAIVPTVHI